VPTFHGSAIDDDNRRVYVEYMQSMNNRMRMVQKPDVGQVTINPQYGIAQNYWEFWRHPTTYKVLDHFQLPNEQIC
jgi:hypothetical protein